MLLSVATTRWWPPLIAMGYIRSIASVQPWLSGPPLLPSDDPRVPSLIGRAPFGSIAYV